MFTFPVHVLMLSLYTPSDLSALLHLILGGEKGIIKLYVCR